MVYRRLGNGSRLVPNLSGGRRIGLSYLDVQDLWGVEMEASQQAYDEWLARFDFGDLRPDIDELLEKEAYQLSAPPA